MRPMVGYRLLRDWGGLCVVSIGLMIKKEPTTYKTMSLKREKNTSKLMFGLYAEIAEVWLLSTV